MPYIGAAAIAVLWWFVAHRPFPNTQDGLYGTAATVASVFAGFLSASKAILLAVSQSEIYKALSKSGYTDQLFDYLKSGLAFSVSMAVLSLVGFLVEANTVGQVSDFQQYFRLVWIFVAAGTILTYWRASQILFKLLKRV